jgi:hypothetical protein
VARAYPIPEAEGLNATLWVERPTLSSVRILISRKGFKSRDVSRTSVTLQFVAHVIFIQAKTSLVGTINLIEKQCEASTRPVLDHRGRRAAEDVVTLYTSAMTVTTIIHPVRRTMTTRTTTTMNRRNLMLVCFQGISAYCVFSLPIQLQRRPNSEPIDPATEDGLMCAVDNRRRDILRMTTGCDHTVEIQALPGRSTHVRFALLVHSEY